MSQRIIIADDLDGSEDAQTVLLGFKGQTYEIDLGAKNLAALEKALDKYLQVARPVFDEAPRQARRTAAKRGSGEDLTAIREWARGQGMQVADRGRVSAAIISAYHAAN